MLTAAIDWFDYVYYRSSLGYRFLRDDTSFSPMLVVVSIQALFIIDIFALSLKVLANQGFVDRTSELRTSIVVVLTLFLIYINNNRYAGRFDQLHEKWKHESRRRRVLKGILVFLTFILPWVPLIVKSIYNY